MKILEENAKTNEEKQMIAKVVTRNTVKTYTLQKYILTVFGYSKKRAKYPVDLTYCGRKCKRVKLRLKRKLHPFFFEVMSVE